MADMHDDEVKRLSIRCRCFGVPNSILLFRSCVICSLIYLNKGLATGLVVGGWIKICRNGLDYYLPTLFILGVISIRGLFKHPKNPEKMGSFLGKYTNVVRIWCGKCQWRGGGEGTNQKSGVLLFWQSLLKWTCMSNPDTCLPRV